MAALEFVIIFILGFFSGIVMLKAVENIVVSGEGSGQP